jgi:hypothetical protein
MKSCELFEPDPHQKPIEAFDPETGETVTLVPYRPVDIPEPPSNPAQS